MPFRIFEFAIGGAIVWIERRPLPILLRKLFFGVGLLLILVPIFTYTEATPFPLHYALPPCIGTALIILARVQSGIGRILSNPVALWIGLVSYSAYLLHWPIYVFYSYYVFTPLTLAEQLGITATTLVLAGLMHRFVEEPFRHPGLGAYRQFGTRRVLFTGGGLLLCTLVLVGSIYRSDGWTWRLPQTSIPEELDFAYSESNVPDGAGAAISMGKQVFIGAPLESAPRKGLIIGDSHADHYRWMFDYLGKKYDIAFMTSTMVGCPPVFGAYKIYNDSSLANRTSTCKSNIDAWESFATDARNDFDFVVLASRWAWMFEPEDYGPYSIRVDYLVDRANVPEVPTQETSREAFRVRMRSTIETLLDAGTTPILIGQAPNHGKELSGCKVPRLFFTDEQILDRCSGVSQDLVRQRLQWIDDEIRAIAAEFEIPFVIPTDFFCVLGEVHCKSMIGTELTSNDGNHLTKVGSLFLAHSWENSWGEMIPSPFDAYREEETALQSTNVD